MSARKSLPIGIIIMTLMVALSVLGVGYAWWTEQLTASGSIQTGDIDVRMESVEVIEDDVNGVGSCNYKLIKNSKVIRITITNAYPGYGCKIGFMLSNYGTVPSRITNINLPLLTGEFSIIPGIKEEVVHPSSPVAGDFDIDIQEKALPKKTYRFELSFDVVQANAP